MYYDVIQNRTKSVPVLLNGKLYVFWDFLKSFGITSGYLKTATHKARRGRSRFYKNVSWTEDNRFNLIQYDSIPNGSTGTTGQRYNLPTYSQLLDYYREHLINEKSRIRSEAEDIIRLNISLDMEKDNSKLTELLASFEKPSDYEFFARIQIASDGKTMQHYQAYGLSRWASVMRLMAQATSDWCERNFARISSVIELRRMIMQYVQQEKKADEKAFYGMKSDNEDYFSRRVREFADLEGEEALRSLISGRFGNTNPQKRTKDHEAVIFSHYATPNKLDALETHRRYVLDMLKQGVSRKECIEYDAVKRFIANKKTQAAAAPLRHGKQYADVKINPMHHRKRPDHSFTMASGDGLWFGLPVQYVKKTWDNVTKTPVEELVRTRLISFIWYDNASGAIIGWQHSYGQHGETTRMVRESLRSITTLNGGRLPRELLMDTKLRNNKSIATFLERANIHSRKKKAHNPKDSMAERFNKEINKYLRQLTDKWANITNHNINFVHNPEHIRECEPMQMSEAIGLIDTIFAIYNTTPQEKLDGFSPWEYMELHRDPKSKVYNELERTMLFDENTILTVRNGVFKLQFEKKEYEFEIPNWEEHLNKTNKGKVRVYFNEAELINGESVSIYNFEDENDIHQDRYICDCKPLKRYSQATIEHTDEDKLALGHHEKRAKAFEKTVEDVRKEYLKHCQEMDFAEQKHQDYYKEAQTNVILGMYKDPENSKALLNGVKIDWPETTEETNTKQQRRKELDRAALKELNFNLHE